MPWNATTVRSSGFTVTAAVWNDELVENMAFLNEIGRTALTSDVSITAQTVGTANQIVSLGAITYEAVPTLLEAWFPRYSAPAQLTDFILRDGTTVIGTLTETATSTNISALKMEHVLTPTAASHTYNIAAWLGGSGTGTVRAGTGGAAGTSATFLQGFMRATRIPT